MIDIKKILIEKLNSFYWRHVTTQDPEAYKKRGNFIASTFRQAEFYGLPNDTSGKIHIKARFLDSQS